MSDILRSKTDPALLFLLLLPPLLLLLLPLLLLLLLPLLLLLLLPLLLLLMGLLHLRTRREERKPSSSIRNQSGKIDPPSPFASKNLTVCVQGVPYIRANVVS